MRRALVVGLGPLIALSGLSAASPEPRFRAQTIDAAIEIGYGLAIADVDGDGRDDILLADAGQIVWYRNPTWEKTMMAERLTARDHVAIAAADLDGDGRAEVAVGAEWNPGDTVNSGAVLVLQRPAAGEGSWTPLALPHEPTTHRMRWLRDPQGPFLAVLPLHGRGNRDARGAGVRFLGYRPPSTPSERWTTFVINDALHATHNFEAAVSPDAPLDLFVAAQEGVHRLRRSGNGWDAVQLSSTPAGEVRLGRHADGSEFLVTIEPMHGNELVVYGLEHDRGTVKSRHILDDTMIQGHALATGDLLGIGSDQIVAGWRGNLAGPRGEVGIKLFGRDEGGRGGWRLLTPIDENQMACEDLLVADLNGDGRLDVIASGRATKNVVIYWNETVRR